MNPTSRVFIAEPPCEPPAPSDRKEAAIIEAARQTFLERGYDGASMDAIALAAGVSKRTVYNRFRSKEDLFAAAITQTCRRILPIDIDAVEASLPLATFLRRMAEVFLRGILEPEAVALHRIAAFEAPRTPALGKTFLDNGPRAMVRAVTPIIARIAARGDLSIDPREGAVEEAVWRFGALLIEPLHTEVLMGQTPNDLGAAIDRQLDGALDAFLRIYSPGR